MAFQEATHPPCSCCGCNGNPPPPPPSASTSASAKRCPYSLPPRPPKRPNNSPTFPLHTTSSVTAASPSRTPKKPNANPTSLFGFSKIPVPTTSSPSVPDPSLPPTFSRSCDGLAEFHVQWARNVGNFMREMTCILDFLIEDNQNIGVGDDDFETLMVDKNGDDLNIQLKCPCSKAYNFSISDKNKNFYYRFL